MTTPEEDTGRDTRISEFASILQSKEGEDPAVVVGGHAVNLWSEYYLARGVEELSGYVPFTSKYLDLVGSTGLLERLQVSHKGKLTRSEARSPVLGRLDIERDGGGFLRVEVLHMVKGLNAKDLTRTMELGVEGVLARLLAG